MRDSARDLSRIGRIAAALSTAALPLGPCWAGGCGPSSTSGAGSDAEAGAVDVAALDVTPYPLPVEAEACPATERAASFAACKETGLICTYVAGCDATPAFDQCQCAEGSLPNGATGLRFECSSACTYSGPLLEGGGSIAGDTGLDAMGDSPGDPDAPESTGSTDAQALDGAAD